MDKKNTNSKTGTANKTTKPQNAQQSATGADAKKQQSNKDVKASTAAPKKEGNKLNPVKPRGKNSEAEKKSLKQTFLKTFYFTQFYTTKFSLLFDLTLLHIQQEAPLK